MRLSIIVPVYNVEKYLAACLDSLILPDGGDYEIIVVNDGSGDGSLALAESYASLHPGLIRIISRENGGLGAARNTGIDAARGDYLMFTDSDDTLAPGALREILDTLDEQFDICLFRMKSVNEQGDEVSVIPACDRQGKFDLPSYPPLLLAAHSACNKIFRRSLFTDTGIRFPGRVWYEDMRTVPKLYLHAGCILALDKPWYVYLQRSGSITNSADTEKNLQIIDALDDLISYYKAQGAYDSYKNELEYSAFYNGFLASSVRVCLADPSSPVLERLREAFVSRFPDYKANPYISSMPAKYKLLASLLMKKRTLPVYMLMKANNILKRKNL